MPVRSLFTLKNRLQRTKRNGNYCAKGVKVVAQLSCNLNTKEVKP